MSTATVLLCSSAAALVAFGMVMLYSAELAGKGAHLLMMQALWGCAGIAACGTMASIDYRHWKNSAKWKNLSFSAWLGAVIMLIVVLKIGAVRNNSRRWFDLGVGMFQPSEAAKVA